ncbi:ATP-binding cassette domain-containing protein [bacterium]|nr:ATP-binding cassette domain-containing protein [bacterium]
MSSKINTEAPSILSRGRRLVVPEVVQTSAMDCGPATLKCLLDGFGMPADYGRLREACQTDVDGTSINTIEDVAQRLGMVARQVMTPLDHLLLPEADLLPAVVVTLQPTGATHFVVVWRVIGSLVQVMDPATGRRWLTRKQFMQEIYRHSIRLPASSWRSWAGTAGFCGPLRARLLRLGVPEAQSTTLLDGALSAPGWRPLAVLDAATRLVESMVTAGGLWRSPQAGELVDAFYQQSIAPPAEGIELIPSHYWVVQPLPPRRDGAPETEPQLSLRGAVALTVRARRLDVTTQETRIGSDGIADSPLPQDLAAVLGKRKHAATQLFDALRRDGLLTPTILLPTIVLAGIAVTVETLLFRGLMDVNNWFNEPGQAVTVTIGIFLFVMALLLLEFPQTVLVRRLGRRMENRLRIALLTKLPRLGDRYFHSRLISDMAHRAYSLRRLHGVPTLLAGLLSQGSRLMFTAAGIIWIAPLSTPMVATVLLVVLGVTVVGQPLLGERDLRVRTHSSALSRFYLDALLGLSPIRAHRAERAVRREQEMLLVSWARAVRNLATLEMTFQGLVALVGLIGAIWIVITYLAGGNEASGVLLLLYWSLNLPVLAQSVVSSAQRYSALHNHLERLLEPLTAPEENPLTDNAAPALQPSSLPAEIALRNVTVVAAGHTILSNLNLSIAPGEHVAVLGASGAGKSTLVSLLLGWQRATAGDILVDGDLLTGERLQALRRTTAWVDPAVQLWNRSLTANLRYGASSQAPLDDALILADLYPILQRLPDGVNTVLGESGGLVSGGEGQRVRLGRALLRPNVRLAILDEPFRGLDRTQRRQLLVNARRQWQDATLLCITHDITETQDFERVLILEDGRIVEDGTPQALLADTQSRYFALIEQDRRIQRTLWGDEGEWRRLHLDAGILQDEDVGI